MAGTPVAGAPAQAPPSYALALAQLCDSALPTGAFSHSFGLERHLARGLVHDEASFTDWLVQFIRIQLCHSDGFAIRLVVEAADAAELYRVDRMLAAATLPRQVRRAAATMGARMLQIAATVCPGPELDGYAAQVAAGHCAGHPAVPFAIVGRSLGVPLPELLAGYLFATVTQLTQNAIRGIPIGQNAGQRVLRAVHPEVAGAVMRIQTLAPEDFGVSAPGLEIAQMQHERQRARMFMS
ncbi:urease accessory protein UreF [Specibacter cremeus]|uniref:urease accessory protein UreF n=1 Tax=Specibacter cremeus TaxID=1629051 RepID=UPI001F0C5653|nr:urease accessory protein UreF [Specibacter cremeus]